MLPEFSQVIIGASGATGLFKVKLKAEAVKLPETSFMFRVILMFSP
ncbi:hypothetical protein OAR19_00315 [bacterium]|nr:hypothetical protein [bacterium]